MRLSTMVNLEDDVCFDCRQNGENYYVDDSGEIKSYCLECENRPVTEDRE